MPYIKREKVGNIDLMNKGLRLLRKPVGVISREELET